MSSTRSTPAPSRSASRPGSGRSGPTPDRDRRQDLEADRRRPHRPASIAHPVGLRARAAPRVGPGGRQVERARPDPLAARQAAPQGLAGDDRRGRQLSADRRADRRGRLPADRQSQPAQAAGRDQGGSGAGRAGHGAALRECGNLARASGAPPLHGGASRSRRQDALGRAQVCRRRAKVLVRDGKVTTLTHYYITSRTLTADQLLEAVRGHWSIENSVHWVLDVVFGDDDQRLRSNYGRRNMALVQRLAINLISRRPKVKAPL